MNFRSKSRIVAVASLTLVLLLGGPRTVRAADTKYPESADGLAKLTQDVLAALKDGKRDVAASLIKSMVLPKHEAWFVRTFGDEKGKELAGLYAKQAETLEQQITKLFEDQLKQNRTNVKAYKLESADDDNATGLQRQALAAMKEKTPLYGVRMVEPGKELGMHLWSFAYVDGGFRLVGKLAQR
jgi:hypothetical protein